MMLHTTVCVVVETVAVSVVVKLAKAIGQSGDVVVINAGGTGVHAGEERFAAGESRGACTSALAAITTVVP